MKKLKIYLDTSVINFLFADDVPDFRKVTEEFFELVKEGESFEVYISDVVINEISKTNDIIKRHRLLSIISEYQIIRLTNEKDTEVSELAELYLSKGMMALVKSHKFPFDKLRANGGLVEIIGFSPFVVSLSNHTKDFL